MAKNPLKNKMNLAIVGIVILIALVAYEMFGDELQGGTQPLAIQTTTPTQTTATGCVIPDDGTTSVTLTYLNTLNGSTSDTQATPTTIVWKSTTSGHRVVGAATSATDFKACEIYVGKAVSSTSVNSKIRSVIDGDGASVNNNWMTITPSGGLYTATFEVSRYYTPQIRVWDNDAGAYIYSGGNELQGAYVASPATLNSSTGAAKAVGTEGKVDYRIDLRAGLGSADFNDNGIWMMVDAPTSTWDTPVVKLNGMSLKETKGSMDSNELASTYGSGAEFVFLIPSGTSVENADYAEINFVMNALSGVDPTLDFNITFAPIGQYRSSADPNNVKRAAYQDDSSKTAVIGSYPYAFDIS